MELQRARDGSFCKDYHNKPLLYCVECQTPICLICKSMEHDGHETEDLREAAARAQGQLKLGKTSVERAQAELRERVEVARREQQTLRDKQAAVEAAIRDRFTRLVAAAVKIRDEELSSVQALSADLQSGLAADLDQLLRNLDEVNLLDQRLDQVVQSGAGCELLTLAKEMNDGKGSQKSVDELTSQSKGVFCRPFLRFSVTDDVLVDYIRRFLGSVDKVWMDVTAPEVTRVERFRCGEEQDIDVFSLRPLEDGKVCVSFARRDSRDDAPAVEKFDEKGKTAEKVPPGSRPGRSRDSENVLFKPPGTESLITTDKSRKKTNFILHNNLSGKADIKRERATPDGRVIAQTAKEFSIKVGAHRAFDVDASERLFVVLEESEDAGTQRKVRLYRRRNENAITTYTPPSAAFQPSDVCFYRLGGQQVLLVSDEGNDAIHVVNVQDGAMRFLRYLAPGCPLVVQPTALNTDAQGRLWVACRGGDIITMTPVA